MTLLLEKTPVELYEAELAATPVPESPADLLPATPAPTAQVAPADAAWVKASDRVTGGPVSGCVNLNTITLSIDSFTAMWISSEIGDTYYGIQSHRPNSPWKPSAREVASVLSGAADRIDEAGWVQHRLFDGERVCAQGAITYRVMRDQGVTRVTGSYRASVLFTAANRALAKWLQYWAPDWAPGMSVPVWNDMPGRTQADVTKALRGAPEAVLPGSIRP